MGLGNAPHRAVPTEDGAIRAESPKSRVPLGPESVDHPHRREGILPSLGYPALGEVEVTVMGPERERSNAEPERASTETRLAGESTIRAMAPSRVSPGAGEDRPHCREGPTPSLDKPAFLASMTREVVELCTAFFREPIDPAQVEDLLTEAWRAADLTYNAAVAAEWGRRTFPGGIPANVVEQHVALLTEAGGDFQRMADTRLDQLRPGRLNLDRLGSLSPGNPELAKLSDLCGGMTIPLPEGFVPNGDGADTRPRLRKTYEETHLAVDSMFYKMVQEGLGLILPMALVRTLRGFHFSPSHWALKQGKESGRPIVDPSNGDDGACVLNGDDVKKAAIERWGAVTLPTIETIMVKFINFKNRSGRPWSGIQLWKMDLRGAFTLLSFKGSNCRLVSTELVGGLSLTFLCGIFGWTATPIAFAVISRAILYEMEQRTESANDMFVDDAMAASLLEKGEGDRKVTETIIEDLMGPGSLAQDKTVTTTATVREIDFVGYTVDIATERVSLTRRNFLKTLYCFFSVDVESKVEVRDLERLASYASRYGMICPLLLPFTRPLYAAYKGLSRSVRVTLKPAAKRAVRLWRAMLCATAVNPVRFARSFDSFMRRAYKAIVEFDASLEGVGIKLLLVDPTQGAEAPVGAGRISLEAFECGTDSGYQNTCEFVALLLGLWALERLAVEKGVKLGAVLLRGDSVAALTWADKQRYRGDAVSAAAALFSLLLVRSDIHITVQHIPGEDNGECDKLSRKEQGEWRSVESVVPGVKDLGMHEDRDVHELLDLCNPRKQEEYDTDYLNFWRRAGAVIERATGVQSL